MQSQFSTGNHASLFTEPTGAEKDIFAPIADEDFPGSVPPELREILRTYHCNLDDTSSLVADPPHWLDWGTLMEWYGCHLNHLKQYYNMLSATPGCEDIRLRSNLDRQWRQRIEPYVVGIRAHLYRIVAEQPGHALAVDKILDDLRFGPTTIYRGTAAPQDDWTTVDRAYASARTFIQSYNNTIHGRIPLGRPQPRNAPDGSVVTWEWQWAAHDDPKRTRADSTQAGTLPTSSQKAGSETEVKYQEGEWSKPMSKTEMMTRLDLKPRAFDAFAKQHGIKPAGSRQQWQIRVDRMDAQTRRRIEQGR